MKRNSTKNLFWFVSVPIVLAWVSFASLAVYQSVVNQIEITENQLTVIGIVGGPCPTDYHQSPRPIQTGDHCRYSIDDP